MLLKLVYLLTCRVLGLPVMVFRGYLAKDAELLVLRHENAVLRRHASRGLCPPRGRGANRPAAILGRRRHLAAAAGRGRRRVMTVRFQSETDGLLMATGERNRVGLLYRTADGGLSWKRVPLDPPPGLPASAATLLDPVTRLGGGVLLVLKAEFRSGSERRPKWEGIYAYRPDGQGGWAGPFRLPLGVVRLSPPHLAVPGPGRPVPGGGGP